MNTSTKRKGPGRPARDLSAHMDVRKKLIRAGVEVLTEASFMTGSLESVLLRAEVPKGSFYYYFESKAAFGMAVLESYEEFFLKLLAKTVSDRSLDPLDRIRVFVEEAAKGMEKHEFRRGCAVANLVHEVLLLPLDFRQKLRSIIGNWENLVAECLKDAKICGQISSETDVFQYATFFWTGWEGAVIRARLDQNRKPLDDFARTFLNGLGIKPATQNGIL